MQGLVASDERREADPTSELRSPDAGPATAGDPAHTSRPGTRQRLAFVLTVATLLGLGLGLRHQIGRDWTFTGADTFAYVGSASELLANHRFAIPLPPHYPQAERSKPIPLAYGRLPAYPAFIAAVAQPEYPTPNYARVAVATKRVQRVLDLVSCLLALLIARRLAGPVAGWTALLLALFSPLLCMYANSVLTECIATLLTTATLSLWLLALLPASTASPRRTRLLWLIGGLVAGLNTLVRIDGLFLLAALLVPILLSRKPASATETETETDSTDASKPSSSPPRLRFAPGRGVPLALLGFVGFMCVYSPWLVRNYVRFGTPHVLAGQCNVPGREMPYTAFFGWFATWLVEERQTPETLYCFMFPHCISSTNTFPASAFDSPEEQAEVARLFALRAANHNQFNEEIDAGYKALTKKRLLSHPLRTLVVLPLKRAFFLWTNPNDQPLRSTGRVPWQKVMHYFAPQLRGIVTTLGVLGWLGLLLVLGLRRFAKVRAAGCLLLTVFLARTGALALIGFVDGRYLIELHPMLYALGGVTVAVAVAEARRWLATRTARSRRARAG